MEELSSVAMSIGWSGDGSGDNSVDTYRGRPHFQGRWSQRPACGRGHCDVHFRGMLQDKPKILLYNRDSHL